MGSNLVIDWFPQWLSRLVHHPVKVCLLGINDPGDTHWLCRVIFLTGLLINLILGSFRSLRLLPNSSTGRREGWQIRLTSSHHHSGSPCTLRCRPQSRSRAPERSQVVSIACQDLSVQLGSRFSSDWPAAPTMAGPDDVPAGKYSSLAKNRRPKLHRTGSSKRRPCPARSHRQVAFCRGHQE